MIRKKPNICYTFFGFTDNWWVNCGYANVSERIFIQFRLIARQRIVGIDIENMYWQDLSLSLSYWSFYIYINTCVTIYSMVDKLDCLWLIWPIWRSHDSEYIPVMREEWPTPTESSADRRPSDGRRIRQPTRQPTLLAPPTPTTLPNCWNGWPKYALMCRKSILMMKYLTMVLSLSRFPVIFKVLYSIFEL